MIYTVTSTLPLVHGGRTKSLLTRIRFLDKEMGIHNKILTTNYNANYNEVYQKFEENQLITKNTQIENIYDWLSDFKLLSIPKSRFKKKTLYSEKDRDIEGLTSKAFNDGNVMRYYDQETYVLYRKFYEDTNIIEFEDVMSPISKKKIERREYNHFGQLHRKIYFSSRTYHKILEEYFDTEGSIYCKKFFNSQKANELDFIQIFKNQRIMKAFKNEKDLFKYYFEHRFKQNDIVFNDARLLDKPLLNNCMNTKNVLVFHNSHIDGDNIKSSYKIALENSDKVAQYLLLTHMQKDDIQHAYGISDEKISIVPHFIKSYGQKDGADEQNQKQVILDLVKEYQIEDKVDLNDFTKHPLEEFKKSKASLLTSEYEGFGLTVMESIEVGCPVISYDVRYGPGEIIEHGENGYLVEPDNIEAFAAYMDKIIKNPLKHVKTKETLKYEQAKNNYQKLFERVK
ncbi:MAG: glycosyltransferase [Staphylococcus epidermidis]|nr:glycosyltransferase [Staphylococcus epidermidis]